MVSEPMLLTVKQAARLLSVSAPLVYRLVHEGQLPLVKIGNASRIPRRALEDLVERLAERGWERE